LPFAVLSFVQYASAITTEALCAAGDDEKHCREFNCPEGWIVEKNWEENYYYCVEPVACKTN
jgi:hypothetical protein